jgi:hypothetical protein
MIVAATLIVLALWIAFIWFFDPDGYRKATARYPEAPNT